MGFNRRKMEDQRRAAAQKEAASRRATDSQIIGDAESMVAAWNGRQGGNETAHSRIGMAIKPARIMPAECAIRRAGAPIANKHR